MKELNCEDVKAYIDFQTTSISKKKQILSHLYLDVLVGMPTAFFGINSDITRIVIPFIITIAIIWAIYLCFGIEKKREGYTLFMGCISFVTLTIFTLAAYKILSTIMEINTVTIIGVLIFYIVGITLNTLNVLRLIKKGYYQKSHKKGSMAMTVPFAVLGLGLGKMMVLKSDLAQDKVVYLIVSCFMLFAFGAMMGTENILKYILMRRLDNNTDCIVIK